LKGKKCKTKIGGVKKIKEEFISKKSSNRWKWVVAYKEMMRERKSFERI
jgi:hypothetical protein